MDLYARIALIDNVIRTASLSPDQFRELKDLLEDFQNEARHKENKAAGTVNIQKAFMTVIKAAQKHNSRNLTGAFKRGEHTYACDGHRLIRTKKDVSLPQAVGADVDTYWRKAESEIARHEEVDLPDPSEFAVDVKTMKKEAGKGYRIIYTFENGLCVDAEYLLEAMKATGTDRLVMDEGATKKPMFFYGDDVDVMLLPVNSESTKPGLRIVW